MWANGGLVTCKGWTKLVSSGANINLLISQISAYTDFSRKKMFLPPRKFIL